MKPLDRKDGSADVDPLPADAVPFLAGPRLSSIEGLQEAGILESFHFDPILGLAGVIYAPAYLEILRSGLLQVADPAFLGGVILDDPVSVRIWVEATAARLAGQTAKRRPLAPKQGREPRSPR
jgi:hypothetical protein